MLRALVTERMDPVLFGYSYDYVGDLAETVSLVWPQSHRGYPEPGADARRCRRKAAGGEPLRRAEGAGQAARQRQHLGALRHHKTGHRRPAHRRLGAAGQAGAGRSRQGRRRRDRGTLARADAALCRAVRLAGRQGGKTGKDGAGAVQAGDAVQPGRRRRSRKARPGRLCSRVEMGRHPRPGDVRRRRSPALFAHRRRCFRRLSRPRRRDAFFGRARRRASGRRPATGDRHVFGPAAAAEPQERDAEDAAAISGLHALLRPAADRRRGFARTVLSRAARASRSLRRRRSIRAASISRRWSNSPTGRRWRNCAGRRRTRSSKA